MLKNSNKHTFANTYLRTYTCMQACMRSYMRTNTYIHTHTHTHTQIYIYIYRHIHLCHIYLYIYTYKDADKHTRTEMHIEIAQHTVSGLSSFATAKSSSSRRAASLFSRAPKEEPCRLEWTSSRRWHHIGFVRPPGASGVGSSSGQRGASLSKYVRCCPTVTRHMAFPR